MSLGSVQGGLDKSHPRTSRGRASIPAIMAAMNKSLARISKSRTGLNATKKQRSTTGRHSWWRLASPWPGEPRHRTVVHIRTPASGRGQAEGQGADQSSARGQRTGVVLWTGFDL